VAGRRFAVAGLLVSSLAFGGGALAAPADGPPDDRVLSPAEHRTEKAQRLAIRHAAALTQLNRDIYFCMPWLEVKKTGIGFFKPRGIDEDKRYLTLNVFIDQDPSPQFSSLTLDQRASAMFSRYAGPLLRRMTRNATVMNDDTIDGFTIILGWLKEFPKPGARPVNETIAIFIERVDADEYLGERAKTADLALRARVLAWDGETPRGALRLAAWDDDFVATYKVKNYEPPVGVTCR
jgi:hypothetical protein